MRWWRAIVSIALLCFERPGQAEENLFPSFSQEIEHIAKSERYLQAGRLDLALDYVEKHLQTNPLDQRALLVAARLYRTMGQWTPLIQTLESCLALNPSPEVKKLYVETLIEQGKTQAAARFSLDTPVDQIHTDAEVRAKAILEQLDSRTASRLLSELDKNRENAAGTYWVAKAKALRLLGRMEEAKAALQIALDLKPDEETTRLEAAQYWEAVGNLTRAAEHLGYLTSIRPENQRAAYRLARIQILRRRSDLAALGLRVRQYLFPDEKWNVEARDRLIASLKRGEQLAESDCQSHAIIRGETLTSLAEKFLGSFRRWPEIQKQNSRVLRDPRRVPSGVEIQICRH